LTSISTFLLNFDITVPFPHDQICHFCAMSIFLFDFCIFAPVRRFFPFSHFSSFSTWSILTFSLNCDISVAFPHDQIRNFCSISIFLLDFNISVRFQHYCSISTFSFHLYFFRFILTFFLWFRHFTFGTFLFRFQYFCPNFNIFVQFWHFCFPQLRHFHSILTSISTFLLNFNISVLFPCRFSMSIFQFVIFVQCRYFCSISAFLLHFDILFHFDISVLFPHDRFWHFC